jgi:hypothetical protein
MTQTAQCQFYEYHLPNNPSWLDRLLMPVSETLGTPGYRQDKSLHLDLDHPELFLNPKAKFSVHSSLLGRIEPNEVEFEVLKRKLRFTEDRKPVIVLSLREVKPKPIERWYAGLPDGWQYGLGATTVVLPLVIIGLIFIVVSQYPNPPWFWLWFAQQVRGIVGWSLFVQLFLLHIWLVFKLRKSEFTQNIFLFIGSLSIFLIPLIWLEVSLPPSELSGSLENTYVEYLNYLRKRLVNIILFFSGTVPWLTLLFKFFGLDLIASFFSLLDEKLKRKSQDDL